MLLFDTMRREGLQMQFFKVLWVFFILQKCLGIDIDDISLPNCTVGQLCGDTQAITTPFAKNVNEPVKKSNDREENTLGMEPIEESANFTTTVAQTTQEPSTTTAVSSPSTTIRNDEKRDDGLIAKNRSDICACDFTISSCDVNCCCDVDCNDFQISAFSRCDNHRPRMYDSRYCYTKNFIQRNNTRFILERLASNLFCVAYDNLPPIYGTSEVPTLRNRKAFEDVKKSIDTKKYTWKSPVSVVPRNFNFSVHYRDDESVWKVQHKLVKLIELPQSGFTGQCAFKKTLKYLETSKWMCMQTNLSEDNPYLFANVYNGFEVISSPHLYNSSYINSSCSNEVCLTPRTLYCSKHWRNCDSGKRPEQSCAKGKCTNAIKRARYAFFHNGTSGIRSVELSLELVNASRPFYQHFEILYEWATEREGRKFVRSGNAGYKMRKPIIFGKLVSNGTKEGNEEQMSVNNSDYRLSIPTSGMDGRCETGERYAIEFGVNARSRCRVDATTGNVSASVTCASLQNRTLGFMIEKSYGIMTHVDKYPVYVSRNGDPSINAANEWTQILLDKIPRNVVTGQIFEDRIRCSGLVTSMKIEILYAILPSREQIVNYKIAGVAATLSEPQDLAWTKCGEKNCTDLLSVELTSLVTFTDVSTPSMYYYAGGPNLDISLPYDFFYPFMSKARDNRPLDFFLGLVLINCMMSYA